MRAASLTTLVVGALLAAGIHAPNGPRSLHRSARLRADVAGPGDGAWARRPQLAADLDRASSLASFILPADPRLVFDPPVELAEPVEVSPRIGASNRLRLGARAPPAG